MSHTTHFDDCGCLTANYERRLDAQKEAVASLEAKVATLTAERDADRRLYESTTERKRKAFARIATLEADYQTARTAVEVESALVRQWQAHVNALRDALEKMCAQFFAGDDSICHAGICHRDRCHRCSAIDAGNKALAQTPAQSLAAAKDSLRSHDAEVLERAAMPLLHKLANLMDAQREEEPHSLLYDTIQLGIIDTEFDIAEIRALAAQEVTK